MEELRARLEEETRSQEEKENLMNGRQSGVEDRMAGGSNLAVPNKRHSPPLSSRSVSSSQRVQSALQARAAAYASLSNSSRPLADVPLPQRGNRATRAVKYAPNHNAGFDRISESEGTEGDFGNGYYTGEETDPGTLGIFSLCSHSRLTCPLSLGGDEPGPISSISTNSTARQRSHGGLSSSLAQSANTRPRRSASLSETSSEYTLDLSACTGLLT